MTRSEAENQLTELISSIQSINASRTFLETVLGGGIEGDLWDGVGRLIDHAISAFESSIGCQFETLYWFIYENDAGKKGLQHSLPNGGMTRVKNICDLLDVLGVTDDSE